MSKILMSTIATTIAGPKTYSAEELQALHLAMNAKEKRKKMLQKTALVTMNLIVCLLMLFPLLYTISVAFMPSGERWLRIKILSAPRRKCAASSRFAISVTKLSGGIYTQKHSFL